LHETIKEVKEIGGFFAATSLILLCGGIGFILSTLYHTLSWLPVFRFLVPAVDHRDLLKYLCQGDWPLLKIRRRRWDNKNIDLNEIKCRGGWEIVTAFWHENRTSIKIIESANPRVDNLQDITHSIGTMYVGSLIAILFLFVFWPWYLCYTATPFLWGWHLILPVVISIMLALIHGQNYREVLLKYQGLINKILLDALEEYRKKKGFYYTAYVAEDDGDIKR
jgi:hypothetical protein